jgi:hypothetical protein
MNNLSLYLKPGTKIGSRSPTYTIEKTTQELIYLRSEPNAKNANGTLRLIPAIVVIDLLKAISEKKMSTDEINRKRDDNESEKLFQKLKLDHDPFILGYESTIKAICEYCINNPLSHLVNTKSQNLPKPFLLLAGISGTGKTRFVREQARSSCPAGTINYALIPVRPDWHEPSDLLGYVSRIGGTHYVATPFLQFMAAAWRDAVQPAAGYVLKDSSDITPFWACLDEMNLAPVEQYFADYLSVLETRQWDQQGYTSEAIFAPSALLKSEAPQVISKLRADLGFTDAAWDGLWAYFLQHGMPLPPNLIVAGTVNMDETTHGFSRKVIDRAFSIDFGEFFPNEFNDYFEPKLQAITLSFPLDSRIASPAELADVQADSDGQKSIQFLKQINQKLAGSPFSLAFRALNELLLMLKCFSPPDESALYAVWDDFLMAKLLPRLEGDEDKLSNKEGNILTQLQALLSAQFQGHTTRPDLFNTQNDVPPLIEFRSLKKLIWMSERLERDRFTCFWP